MERPQDRIRAASWCPAPAHRHKRVPRLAFVELNGISPPCSQASALVGQELGHIHFHFRAVETEDYRGQVTCPVSPSFKPPMLLPSTSG